MIRRVINVAAALSLLVAAQLASMTYNRLPLMPRWIGNPDRDGWAVGIHLGRIMVTHVTNGALLSVPFAASLQSLAIPFAVWPLAWGVILYREERRRRARGFPIEVSRYAPSVESTANRGPEVPGGETGEAAQSQSHPQG